MRIRQFRLHEPLKTVLNQTKHAKSEPVSHVFFFEAKHAKLAHFLDVSFWFTMILKGSCNRNCGNLTLFRLVLDPLASLKFFLHLFCFVSLRFASFFRNEKKHPTPNTIILANIGIMHDANQTIDL
jgi:hypothetical protein